MEKYFLLQKGEKVVKEIKPLPRLKWYFFLSGGHILTLLIFSFVFLYVLYGLISTALFETLGVFLTSILFVVGIFVAKLIYSYLRYRQEYYWITNKRIIAKRGLLGYRITSIPFERISDITISRNFLERLLGLGSLHIQSLAGQFSYSLFGSEASLLAIPDPEKTQELILELIKQKRVEEKLTF